MQSVTVPGITTAMSAQRQTGALSVATTDDNGNLAYDGGAIFTEIANNRQGVAIALAAQNPDLVAGEAGAIALNFGRFRDAMAAAFNFSGVLAEGIVLNGDRLTINAGIGVDIGDVQLSGRRSDLNVGGTASINYKF
ncbi:MAG: hypothetical protein GY942_06295 [Aestuariibacter sp.]|nr:hypothetical protein [Aestuariibacter sp.]